MIKIRLRESKNHLKNLAEEHDIDLGDLDMSELEKGVQVEQEHGDKFGKDVDVIQGRPWVALQIAVAHLRELPDYYTRLSKIEEG